MVKTILTSTLFVLFVAFGAMSAAKMVSFTDVSKCVACGTCVKVCPTKAITLAKVNGKMVSVVDPAKCVGCGTCVKSCPTKALSLKDASTLAKPADVKAADPKTVDTKPAAAPEKK